MDAPMSCDRAKIEQHLSVRNSELRDNMATIKIKNVYGALVSAPFCYPEKMSKNVSEGIVRNGDKLMSNVEVESDEEERMEELNNVGQDFQAMSNVTALKVRVEDKDHSEKDKLLDQLYPMPQGFYVTDVKSIHFSKSLEEMRNYLKMRAYQGVSAVIALIGNCSEDGVYYGAAQTIPVDIIEGQIQNFLEGRGKQLAPMAVDLVVFKDGKLHISTMKPNESAIKRSVVSR